MRKRFGRNVKYCVRYFALLSAIISVFYSSDYDMEVDDPLTKLRCHQFKVVISLVYPNRFSRLISKKGKGFSGSLQVVSVGRAQ